MLEQNQNSWSVLMPALDLTVVAYTLIMILSLTSSLAAMVCINASIVLRYVFIMTNR